MSTAKKPKLEATVSFQPVYDSLSDDEDDDDLFISIWDGQSTKKTLSGDSSTKPKPKPLSNTGTASDSNEILNKNTRCNVELDTSKNDWDKPAFSGVNSSNNVDLDSNKSNLDKPSCLELNSSSHNDQNTGNNIDVDSSTNDMDKPSCSGLSISIKHENQDTSNNIDLDNGTNDWDKPSCSGVNTRDLVDLSFDTNDSDNIQQLQTMFPFVDKDVLKSYIEIYQEIGECVRVISNLLYGGNEDIVYVSENVKNNTAIESTKRIGDQTVNSPENVVSHEPESPSRGQSDSSTIQDASPINVLGAKKLKNHVSDDSQAIKSENKLKLERSLPDKVPMSNRDVIAETAINSLSCSLATSTVAEATPTTGSKCVSETNIKSTQSKFPKKDIKVCKKETKPSVSQPLPATDDVQVGINIRFGKNKVHPSMKKCVDRIAASRDIAQPYRGETSDAKPRTDNSTSNMPSLKHKSDQSINPSPSKKICDRSPQGPSFKKERSIGNSRNKPSPSSSASNHSSNNSFLSENTRGHNTSSSASSSRHTGTSDFSVSNSSTPENTKDHTFLPCSSGVSSRSENSLSTPSSSRHTGTSGLSISNPSTTENTRDCTSTHGLSSLSSSDLRFVIDSVSRMLSVSQGQSSGNPVLNHCLPKVQSKKGKGPKISIPAGPSSSPTKNDQGSVIDWGSVVSNTSGRQSPATNIHHVETPDKTKDNHPTSFNQENLTNNDNQISSANAAQTRSETLHVNQDKIVLVVSQGQSTFDTNPSGSQNHVCTSLQEMIVSSEEERAVNEMLDLQKETEILSKICPENDPNFIFDRLENLKDNPNRVAIVNKELIQNGPTNSAQNIVQKRKKIIWSWEDKKLRIFPFSNIESNMIESKYIENKKGSAVVKFSPVTRLLQFDFYNMIVKDNMGIKVKHIYRTEDVEDVPHKDNSDKKDQTDESPLAFPLSNPETWHGHSSNTSKVMTPPDIFEVLSGTIEFAHVDGLLRKSLPQAVVKKIKRVRNDWLERKYGIQRALLKEKNGPGGINEKELFHGTRLTPPSTIWNSEDGFDMRYSADGMWGRGCYFAVHAAYSHHQFTYQFMKKHQRYYQIFLAHVLTGESVKMNPDRGIKKPPCNLATGRQYDSITGVTHNHQIYVLYKNEVSFPAYLITYTV